MTKELGKAIRDRLTPKEKRVLPGHVGDDEGQEGPPLTYARCVYHLRESHIIEDMAKEAGISPEEMRAVLEEYGLLPEDGTGPYWWTAAEMRGRGGHHLHHKY